MKQTDLAGNTTELSTNFMVITDSTAPVMALTYPQDGMRVSGNTLTLEGLLDDPSATVSLSLTNEGAISEYLGVIERNGRFWIEDLPLVEGSNYLQIVASDAWNNVSSVSLMVVQSDVALTITPPSEYQLYGATAAVNGTVANGTYIVRVNGVLALNQGGQWSAEAVPVSAGGVASFTVVAYPPGHDQDPAAALHRKVDIEKAPRLYIAEHYRIENGHSHSHTDFYQDLSQPSVGWTEQDDHLDSGHVWFDRKGGNGWWYLDQIGSSQNQPPVVNHCVGDIIYPPSSYPDVQAGTRVINPECIQPRGPETVPYMPLEFMSRSQFTGPFQGPPSYDPGRGQWVVLTSEAEQSLTEIIVMALHTGGKSAVRKKNLFSLSAWAEGLDGQIAPTSIELGHLGQLGSDGVLYKVLPDDRTFVVTPIVIDPTYRNNYQFQIYEQKHRLALYANNVKLDSENVVPSAEFCVGMKLNLHPSFSPALAEQPVQTTKWQLKGNFVNERWRAQRWVIIPGTPGGYWESYGSTNYRMNPDLLTENTVSAWWTSGSNPACKYTMRVTQLLEFNNGQSAHVDARGVISMFRPGIIAFNPSPPFFASLVPTGADPEDLKLGDEFGSGAMAYSLNIVGSFPGYANIVQLINASRAVTGPYGGLSSTTQGEFWADGGMFYLGDGEDASKLRHEPESPAFLAFDDGPWVRLTHPIFYLNQATIVDYFKDYIVFCPDGDPDNIYVTLGRTFWDWSAITTRASETTPWQSPVFDCQGPSNPDGSEEFPTWLETY